MKKVEKKYLIYLKEYGVITIGALLVAVSINYFYLANKLGEGGVTGICLVLDYLFKFRVSITYLAINIPLVLIGWKLLGTEYFIKTLYGTVCVSFFVELTHGLIALGKNDDMLLVSIYGGITIGTGLGLIFISNGSTGGTDIIACILNKYFKIPIGRTMLVLDIIILGVLTVILGRAVMYTLIAVALSAKSIDYLQDGVIKVKKVVIVSNKAKEIKERIFIELKRGVTIIKGEGGYTGNNLDILHCIVSKFEVRKLKKLVEEIDENAFLTVSDVSEVLGQGFQALASKKNKN